MIKFLAPSFQRITKSLTYLSIEKELEENKQNISQLPRDSSFITELRTEAERLVIALSHEIRKEIEQQHNEKYQNEVGK